MVRVEQVLDSWKTIRHDTAAAVEDMPESELDFRATPEIAAFREIATHILNASAGLTGMMLAGEDDFTAPEFRDRMKQHMPAVPAGADRDALAAALRSSIDRIAGQLADRPAEWFAHMMTRFDGQRVTRLEMIQFIKEHELTHRAQLFMDLRLKGIVPATTRRRMAKQGGG